jgi:hypothetical protein
LQGIAWFFRVLQGIAAAAAACGFSCCVSKHSWGAVSVLHKSMAAAEGTCCLRCCGCQYWCCH